MSGENPTPIQGDLFSQFDAESAAAAERIVEQPKRKVVPPKNPYATQEMMADIREQRDNAQLAEAIDRTGAPSAEISDTDAQLAESSDLSGPELVREALRNTTPQPDIYGPREPKPARPAPRLDNPAA